MHSEEGRNKMINTENNSISQNSLAFGFFIASGVVLVIMFIDTIRISLFEQRGFPERTELLIPLILVLIILIGYGITLVYIIRFFKENWKNQINNKTIFISFVISFIIYIITFWVLGI